MWRADKGAVPLLEKMADSAVSSVELLRIGGLQCVHEGGQRRRALLYREVNVVGHQAIRVQPKPESLPVKCDSFEVVPTVRVVAKHIPTLVSACDQVMEGSRNLQSRWPCHPREIVASATAG